MSMADASNPVLPLASFVFLVSFLTFLIFNFFVYKMGQLITESITLEKPR